MTAETSAGILPPIRSFSGVVLNQHPVSSSMIRLDIELDGDASFAPGQFCMINLGDGSAMSLSRPLSILAAAENRLSLLYKIVGRGTRALSAAVAGQSIRLLSPLGNPFPRRDTNEPRLLLAGGVGLPPLASWAELHGREDDLCCFGARDGADAPWPLLPPPWQVSVDADVDVPADHTVHHGNVVELARNRLANRTEEFVVLACGPTPLLRAAAELAAERGWTCLVSIEERMGCGYGVCRGCVVPSAGDAGWQLACHDGPVIDASTLDWERLGLSPEQSLSVFESGSACVSCPSDQEAKQ
jgi:dihydroorotate dehydrogenase electron transfer subunit